ncbi:MAG: methyltransferase [Candidatus Omnitrophota bacterium]
MNITIEKVVYPGKSLARIEGKVVFTDQGLPGETVEAAVIKETRGYIKAKTVKVIAASAYHQEPRCKHYRVCSPYQYIDYTQQIEIKKQQLEEIILRRFDLEPSLLHFRPSPRIWGYRNKIKVKIIRPSGLPQLAYNLPEIDDEFVPVDQCFLSPELTNSFMNEFIKKLSEKDFIAINQSVIKENKSNKLLICFYYDGALDIGEFSLAFKSLFKQFEPEGVTLIDNESRLQTVIYGDNFIQETINDKQFFISSDSFFQINIDALKLLIKDLEDNLTLNKDTVLADLYCGVGTFGILLAEQVKQVIGVEIEQENFLFLEKNIKANNLKNFEQRFCDCNDTLKELLAKNIDIVIIDPPRKGASAQVCAKLVKSAVNTFVYISCDPATLARDLKILLSAYKIKNVYAYDFFPQTPHIETMIILEKKHS